MNDIVRRSEEPWKGIVLSWATLVFMILNVQYANETFMGLGAAILFMVCFALNPEGFRNRRGSYRTVYGLMSFLWLCAAIPTVLTWF
jgi:hypothetical protein